MDYTGRLIAKLFILWLAVLAFLIIFFRPWANACTGCRGPVVMLQHKNCPLPVRLPQVEAGLLELQLSYNTVPADIILGWTVLPPTHPVIEGFLDKEKVILCHQLDFAGLSILVIEEWDDNEMRGIEAVALWLRDDFDCAQDKFWVHVLCHCGQYKVIPCEAETWDKIRAYYTDF